MKRTAAASTRKPAPNREPERLFEPSAFVRRFAATIVNAAEGKFIADVGCGSGRNAICLAHLGCNVVCMDKDLTRLRAEQLRWGHTILSEVSKRLIPQKIDFLKEPWPFSANTLGGIVCVHFFITSLLEHFENSLSPGGYLLIETVPGCGENYRELPKAGTLRRNIETSFDCHFYKERRVGPDAWNAVTVQTLARRRW